MKRAKSAHGQSLLEFAATFPLLILLVLGLFDLGRAIFYYATLNTAVREGTRFAIVLAATATDKPGKIVTEMKKYLWANDLSSTCDLNSSVCKITVTYYYPPPPSPYSTEPYDPTVSVAISYRFETITPGLSLIVGNGGRIPLNVSSTMLLAPYAKPAY